jgi:Family of unknown function (DUF5677)
VTEGPLLGPGRKLSDGECQAALDALRVITRVVLFEFMRQPRDIRDNMLRNYVARAEKLAHSVFVLWGLEDFQSCGILFRCLLERYFLIRHLWDTNGFEEFERWSFLEEFKAVQRVRGDDAVDTSRSDLFVPPTDQQRKRAAALFKEPPKWRRPKAEDVAKSLHLGFLYTYGYLHASAQVHPMADDGLQDFHMVTGAMPAPDFPDQSAVLSNTLLVNTLLLQDAMNASSMRWMAVVFNALNDVREFLADGHFDVTDRISTLAAAFQQNMVLSESKPNGDA